MKLFRERKLSLDDAYARERQQAALAPHIAYPAIQNTGVKVQGEWPEPVPEQTAPAEQPTAPVEDLVAPIRIDSHL